MLVTGAGGFLGRHVVPALVEAGWDVDAVSRAPHPSSEHVTWHQVDLLEAGASATMIAALRPSHLLHLAWYAVPGAYWTSAQNLDWVGASLRIAREFADAGGQRLVGVGSCAEYEWGHGTCREAETPLRPATLYGAAKHAVATTLAAWAPTAGVSFAWARLFQVYGPGEPAGRLVSDLVAGLAAGREIPLSAGDTARDYVHAADVAAALRHLLEQPAEGFYNVGTGVASTVRTVAETAADRAGRHDLLRFGARPADPKEPQVLVADISRLVGSGWAPRFDLSAGLAQTYLAHA